MYCTKAAISQNYELSNLRDDIRTHIKDCKIFQNNKRQNLKYGKNTRQGIRIHYMAKISGKSYRLI